MPKIDILMNQLEAIKTDIEKLSGFRDTHFVRKFRRQLEGEKSVILEKISKLTRSRESVEQKHLERLDKANQNRSSKMKRNWNYYKDIQKNYYGDKSLKEIRRLHKLHRHGLETDISDVAWRNPSP